MKSIARTQRMLELMAMPATATSTTATPPLSGSASAATAASGVMLRDLLRASPGASPTAGLSPPSPASAQDPQCCNNASCTVTSITAEPTTVFKRCRGCKSVWYCSRKCQKIDWPNHKHEKECAPLRTVRDQAKAAAYVATTTHEASLHTSGYFLQTKKRSSKQRICRRLADGRVLSIDRQVAGPKLTTSGSLFNGGVGIAHLMSRMAPSSSSSSETNVQAKAIKCKVTEAQARHLLEHASHLLLTSSEQRTVDYVDCC